jgi:membrane protease YdiL (CAAX protease family)
LVAFGVFFLLTAFLLPPLAFLLFRLFEPGLQFQNLSGVQAIVIQALMDLVLVAFIVLRVRSFGRRAFETLRWIPAPAYPVRRMVAAGAVLAITVTVISRFLPESPSSELEKLLATTASYILFVLFGIVFAPVCEEIIFRGFLFTALVDTCGVKAAILITAAIFALLHVPLRIDNLPSIPVIFGAGLIFTLVRHRSGSVIPSVMMHTVYNAMIFAISALATLGQRPPA